MGAVDVPVCCGVTASKKEFVLDAVFDVLAVTPAAVVPVRCSSGARNGLFGVVLCALALFAAVAGAEGAVIVLVSLVAVLIGSYGGGASSGSGSMSASLLRDMMRLRPSEPLPAPQRNACTR